MGNLFGFLDLEPQMRSASNPRCHGQIMQGLEFRHVSFSYPGRQSGRCAI